MSAPRQGARGEAAPHGVALRDDAIRERWSLFSLSAPALALVTLILLLPVGWLFWLSFLSDAGEPSLEHYRRMASQASYARIFRLTFADPQRWEAA